MKYQMDIPYPKVRVMKKNPYLGKLLLHSYAGDVSEDTAIHQYLYQSLLMQDENLEIAEILEKISETEMHHLYILGKLIQCLGVYPVYVDPVVSKNCFWTSKYVDYNTNILEMLESDIEAEQKAIQTYQELIHVIDDKYVVEILKRIVLDERLHLEIFEKLKKSLD